MKSVTLRLATDPASLKTIRANLGLTAAQMADALNTPLATYSPWEQGRRKPPGCLSVALEWVILEVMRDRPEGGDAVS